MTTISMLGPVGVGADGTSPGGPKLQLLLALLAADPGSFVTVDALEEALWDEGQRPGDPQHAIQAQVSKLRGVLRRAGVDGTVDRRGDGYVLVVDDDDVDAARFDREVQAGLSLLDDEPVAAAAALEEALDRWRGPAFGAAGDHPALRPAVSRLEQLRWRAREGLARARSATGDHAGAVEELRSIVAARPLRESAWELLLDALARDGQQAAALEAYEEARAHLAEELGADPSPALRELHGRILRQEVAPTPQREAPGPRRAPARSLAVLPFEVIGESSEARELALGLHSDLLSELARVPSLTVISRSSAIAIGPATSVPDAARQLGVGAIVEGTVQSGGTRVRLRVQLVDARRDTPIWSHAYDRALTPDTLFALQDELARDLAGALSTELAPRREWQVDAGRADDLEAFRLVAVGREHLDRKTENGHRRAVEAFEEATERDPGYVRAWAGLAGALISMQMYGHGDGHDLLPRAQRAAHRAVSLDPVAAEARTSLGQLHVAYQRSGAAIAELDDAIRIQPGNATAHAWLTWVLLLAGRFERADEVAARTVELDPRSGEAHAHVALAHLALGRPVDGLAAARRARECSPYTTAELYEGVCLQALGRHEQVLAVLAPLTVAERGAPGVPWTACGPDVVSALSMVALGDVPAARRTLDDVREHGDELGAALVLLALDDVAGARRHLARVHRVGQWPALATRLVAPEAWARLGDDRDQLMEIVTRSWREGVVSDR